jgi:hypothetical protein
MKRTYTDRPHPKARFKAFFMGLQTDARSYPGGLPELAHQLGRNYGPVKNALCPTHEDAEPTLELVLEIIEATGGQQAAQAVARLAGMTALPIPHAGHGEATEVMSGFMSVVKEAGRLDMQTAEALEDGKLSVIERQTIAASLDALISAAVEMRAMVRGA